MNVVGPGVIFRPQGGRSGAQAIDREAVGRVNTGHTQDAAGWAGAVSPAAKDLFGRCPAPAAGGMGIDTAGF